ncbi:hypothetical protein Sango_0363400 [Sesamum angolense]|uniref:Uncharacterized protein n=1 Tax=Sesamum angolense TaxID=2727404 RepID=A0AAE2C3L4_9LAMI|nr:hypothetical protein Sango_0363400 [Sesamum angolense]
MVSLVKLVVSGGVTDRMTVEKRETKLLVVVGEKKERGVEGRRRNSFYKMRERKREVGKIEMEVVVGRRRKGGGGGWDEEEKWVSFLKFFSFVDPSPEQKSKLVGPVLFFHTSLNIVFGKYRVEDDFPSDSQCDEILLEESSERYGFVGLTGQLDNDPNTYGEAMSDIDLDKRLEVMKSEMDLMGSNQVWTLVDPPKGVKPLGYKWVYKQKEIYMDQPKGFTSVEKCRSDASFQSDNDDAKCQSSYVFKLNGGVVAWKSSKQAITTDSTIESNLNVHTNIHVVSTFMDCSLTATYGDGLRVKLRVNLKGHAQHHREGGEIDLESIS